MSFAWLHKKISLRASIVAICVALLVTILFLQVGLSIYESKIDGDTPEICRLYLEQNAFVRDHFGQLHEERFVITDERLLSHPGNDPGPKEAEPRLSGLPSGPLAIVFQSLRE